MKLVAINDPLGQPHSLTSSEHCFLCFVLLDFENGYGRTETCVKTMIPTAVTVGWLSGSINFLMS